MISCLIVEDEAAARQRLAAMIQKHNLLQLAGQAASGREAIRQIDALRPQLIFLDVHLPDISGLDILKVLQHKPLIIFTTAYDQYAVQAFEHNALDYLLKPFSEQRFMIAVEKAIGRLTNASASEAAEYDFLQQTPGRLELLTRLPAKVGDKIYLLNAQDIVYFGSSQKVVTAHLQKDYFIVNYTLDELQARLDGDMFFRIHRSTIVNLNFVQTIEPLFGGTYLMKMKDSKHTELNVSRNAGRVIRQRLGW